MLPANNSLVGLEFEHERSAPAALVLARALFAQALVRRVHSNRGVPASSTRVAVFRLIAIEL